MTIRVTFNQTCDRCERPFDQKILKAGATVPGIKSQGYVLFSTVTVDGETTQSAKPIFNFEDVCPACREAVLKLVEKIRLSSKKPTAKPKAKADPKVDEKGEPVRRKRRTKAEMEAARASEAGAKGETGSDAAETPAEYSEPEAGEAPKADEPKAEAKPEGEDLGLAGDDNAKEREEAEVEKEDDDFGGRETFEDPDSGDVVDVHTGEVLAKRVDGAGDTKDGTHPF